MQPKLIKALSFLALLSSVALLTALRPGVGFEGKVVYSIRYLSLPAEVEGLESMLSKEMTMYFKGPFTRIEQSLLGSSQVIVSNEKDTSGFMLMDVMGQRIHVPLGREELKEAMKKQAQEPKVEYTGKTIDILGYACREAVLSVDGKRLNAFIAKDLGMVHSSYKFLDGFPLRYTTVENGMELEVIATNVSKEAVSDELFSIPEGYQTLTMEELQTMGM